MTEPYGSLDEAITALDAVNILQQMVDGTETSYQTERLDKPLTNSVYLFMGKGWRSDGYCWKAMGTHRLPTISPVYTKSYYQAHVDGKADGRFRKFAYQLVSNPEFAVVQYLGDSSVARENPRKRSPSSFDGAVAARKKTGNHSRKTDKLKVTQVRCNRRVKKKLTESPIDDEHINVAVDYLSENSETEAAVVEETPEALARATVEEGRVVLVPSMQVWIVRDVQGRKFMTELFPFINCSCGSSNCFHILTAALSCGYQLPIPNQPRP